MFEKRRKKIVHLLRRRQKRENKAYLVTRDLFLVSVSLAAATVRGNKMLCDEDGNTSLCPLKNNAFLSLFLLTMNVLQHVFILKNGSVNVLHTGM